MGKWPNSWPKELEPYRKQAATHEIGTGIQENVYEIRFKNREDFEKIWPTILRLKDKKSPLRLQSIEKPNSLSLSNGKKPMVRVYSYVYPAWPVRRPGRRDLRPSPPWPDSIKSPTGELPEHVTISEDGSDWVPAWISIEKEEPWDITSNLFEDQKPRRFIYRARTEIELVVDGKIIDLNRIQLPTDTPIIDRRFEDK